MLDVTRLRVIDAVARLGSVTAAAKEVEGIVASEIPGSRQHIYAATYGEPPDPPATTALLAALAEAAASVGDAQPTQPV